MSGFCVIRILLFCMKVIIFLMVSCMMFRVMKCCWLVMIVMVCCCDGVVKLLKLVVFELCCDE